MNPKIIAHRGHSKKYPENTMIAFMKALEAGADGSECDLHLTKDKKIAIHHYYTLGHTDNGNGYIFEKDAHYLQSLDCGSWFSPEFKDERIPLLDTLLKELGGRAYFELELKDFGREFADAVLSTAKEYDQLNKVTFTSYQYPLLSYLKTQEPSARVGLIAQPIPEWMDIHIAHELIKSSLLENKIDVIHCPIDIYTEDFVANLRSMGVTPHGALCDTKEQLQKAQSLQLEEISTNELEQALTLFNKAKTS